MSEFLNKKKEWLFPLSNSSLKVLLGLVVEFAYFAWLLLTAAFLLFLWLQFKTVF